jgi:hypothetical protein
VRPGRRCKRSSLASQSHGKRNLYLEAHGSTVILLSHSDHKYSDKIYEAMFTPELCAKLKSKTQEDQIKVAKNRGKGPDG